MLRNRWKGAQDWVIKVIHWELCKRLEFGHADKNKSLSKKMSLMKVWETLRYKQKTYSQSKDLTEFKLTRRNKLVTWQILPFQRIIEWK